MPPKGPRCTRVAHEFAPNGKCLTCHYLRGISRKLEVAFEEVASHWPPPDFCDLCTLAIGIPQYDHDHRTKQFRGWLCRGCNIGLGNFEDDVDRLGRAIDYLISRRIKYLKRHK